MRRRRKRRLRERKEMRMDGGYRSSSNLAGGACGRNALNLLRGEGEKVRCVRVGEIFRGFQGTLGCRGGK
jgi:hypothetical protein